MKPVVDKLSVRDKVIRSMTIVNAVVLVTLWAAAIAAVLFGREPTQDYGKGLLLGSLVTLAARRW